MKRTPSTATAILRYIPLLVGFAVAVFPLLWMFRVSLLPGSATISLSNAIAEVWTFANYVDLLGGGAFARPLLNSLLVGGVVTVGNILFCFMAGYAFARYRVIESKLLFATVILVLMIPMHIIIVPLYLLCLELGIYDSYWALILPWLVNPIGVFLVKQYIESLPSSVEDAARIDGAGELTVLFRIVMPLCKPVLAVLAIQVFFTNWNSFLFPFILTSSDSLRTIPVALALYQGHQAIDWPHLMAGSSIAVLPVLALFLIMQRHVVSGVTSGAVK